MRTTDDLEQAYGMLQQGREMFDKAGTNKEKAEAVILMDSAADGISNIYMSLWVRYRNSRDYGNEVLDLDESQQVRNIGSTVGNMKRCGIKKFTYSAACDETVEGVWEFIRNGCQLQGMTEINGKGEEKAHGFLFTIGQQ